MNSEQLMLFRAGDIGLSRRDVLHPSSVSPSFNITTQTDRQTNIEGGYMSTYRTMLLLITIVVVVVVFVVDNDVVV